MMEIHSQREALIVVHYDARSSGSPNQFYWYSSFLPHSLNYICIGNLIFVIPDFGGVWLSAAIYFRLRNHSYAILSCRIAGQPL